ncbi:hypothetical protein COL940_010070 [Colletotrichum noveboracense]|nr:hypothetical protein COL940_010070 [Colletotrichum noveboracense]
MRSDTASAVGLLAGLITTAAARPDLRYQQIRRQNAQDCLEDLEDILDDAPTTSLWPATACDFTSTLSGAELTTSYASFRSKMASWYSNDLDDITKLESSCTQYVSVFDSIRYCYVTGPVIVNNVRIGNGNGGKHHSRIVDGQQDLNGGYEHINNQCDINLNAG